MSIETVVTGRLVTSKLICDVCNTTIAVSAATGIDAAERGLSKEEHKDQNWGHECPRCRTLRHNAYDRWVTRTQDEVRND